MSFCYVIALCCGAIKLITNLTLPWQVAATLAGIVTLQTIRLAMRFQFISPSVLSSPFASSFMKVATLLSCALIKCQLRCGYNPAQCDARNRADFLTASALAIRCATKCLPPLSLSLSQIAPGLTVSLSGYCCISLVVVVVVIALSRMQFVFM